MKKCALVVLSLVFLLTVGLVALIFSESGSQWLLGTAITAVPGKMSVNRIEGRLLDHISLDGIRYDSSTVTLELKTLDLRWQPSALLGKKLKILGIIADELRIIIPKDKGKSDEDKRFDGRVSLPLKFDIDRFLLTNARILVDDAEHRVDRLQFRIETQGETIKLSQLELSSDMADANGSGDVVLAQDLPLNLAIRWTANTAATGKLEGDLAVEGDLKNLGFIHRFSPPMDMTLKGNVGDVLTSAKFNIAADWRQFSWPLSGENRQILSREGHLSLSGAVDEYRLSLAARLERKGLPEAELQAEGRGSLKGFTLNALALSFQTGRFDASGHADWHGTPNITVNVGGKDFNPAIFSPDFPGKLTLKSRIQAKLEPKAPQVSFDLQTLTGILRNQPVQGRGRFKYDKGILLVNDLKILSGSNSLNVNGIIDENNGDIDGLIDFPKLATLWPGLSGKLSAKVEISSGWKNPAFKLALTGKNLSFHEQSVADLDLDASYYSDEKSTSQLSFNARHIQSDGIKISSMNVNSNGNLGRHDFRAELSSPQVEVKTALVGQGSDLGWLGDLALLDIKETNGRLWRLPKKTLIEVRKRNGFVAASWSESCLTAAEAGFCSQGQYSTQGDLNLKLDLHDIPANLLNPLLPSHLAVHALVDGSADLHLKQQQLDGKYRISTTPILVNIQSQQGIKALKLGESSVSGTVSGENMTAAISLNMNDHDFVKSELRMDVGKSQTLTGQVRAAIDDFSWVQIFAPQLSHVGGHLSANVNLHGKFSQPAMQGSIDFTDGHFDAGQFGIRQSNLRVMNQQGSGNTLSVSGSMTPIVLNPPGKPQKFELKTQLNYSGEIQPDRNFQSHFSVNLSPDTSLTMLEGQNERQIKFGASRLTGKIDNDVLTADLDMALPGNDFVRADVALGLGNSQSLSGAARAAFTKLDWIEMVAPDLAKVKGALNADMTFTGTRQNPQVNGTLVLANTHMEVIPLGITLQDLNLTAAPSASSNDRIQLRGSVKSGEGQLKLTGEALLDPKQQWPVTMQVIGSDFEVAKLPEAEIAVSPNLRIQTNLSAKAISGEIALPKAIIKIQELPENAVKVSEDEIILGEETTPQTSAAPNNISVDIDLGLGKNVKFSGQGLDVSLGGKLKIIKRSEKLAMQGNVDTIKGQYKRFGQDLTVRKGRFVFNGPADNPWLDVEAIRLSKNKKVTAVLGLSGTLQKPQTKIFAEPALPETEALAYLVTGNPLSQASKADSNMLASAALSYGAGKAGWLADQLGIHEFGIEEGASLKDTLLMMGQYLTPDFYIGTRVGMAKKQAALVLKHNITDNINVETQTGTSQRIKLNYEFDSEEN